MSGGRVYIEGELFLRLETVAEIYRVRAVLLREACEHGLIGPATLDGPHLCIAAVQLDRVAQLVRLHVGLGLDLRRIASELSAAELGAVDGTPTVLGGN